MTVGMMLVLILARIPVFGLLLPLSEILLAPLPPAASFLVRFFVLFCWCCSCLFLFLIIVVVITTMIFATAVVVEEQEQKVILPVGYAVVLTPALESSLG